MRPYMISLCVLTALATPRAADAFCGFYVNGGGADLYNNATQVVMMRMGTRTVLSMQNNYQGPPENFAMVIPVPEVLQEANVKTLAPEIFARVDQMSAPRLVEYWEQDPCAPPIPEPDTVAEMEAGGALDDDDDDEGGDLGVTVEAQFKVGEYEIVILSARESTGLETWLKRERYQIPAGAEPLLRPYVQSGMKFFVAKVDTAKVRFQNGMAMLSPLRFHYDDTEFRLPIRLGLVNSAGTQDLIVHVLAPNQRYALANYKNVTIPTNLDVRDAVRARFGEFYAALFDATLDKNPGAVVTEYAWDASSCDPCPGPVLGQSDLATLGADVLGGASAAQTRPYRGGFVLTRLHARYGADSALDDLVFKAAPPLLGGREVRNRDGQLEHGATAGGFNNFQGRYAIRHEWTGAMTCANPVRGIWGGPPRGVPTMAVQPATDLAFAPRGQASLPAMVASAIPELAVQPGFAPVDTSGTRPSGTRRAVSGGAPKTSKGGCGCAVGGGGQAASLGLLVALGLLLRPRRS